MPEERIYVLKIVDNDDEYIYVELIYNDLDTLNKAKQAVKKFDEYWYNRSFEEEMEEANYFEEMMEYLEDIELLGTQVYSDVVYIRQEVFYA